MTDEHAPGPEAPQEPPEAGSAGTGGRKVTAAHPLVAGAVFVALLASVSRAVHPGHAGVAASAPPAPLPSYEVPCPSGSVADFPRSAAPNSLAPNGVASASPQAAQPNAARAVCIPVPLPREEAHQVVLADALERRADRPKDFARYALPIDSTEITPDALVDNAPSAADALRFVAAPGALARALKLDGQVEPTRVVFAGTLNGSTVITAHVVPRERGAVTFLLVYSGLESLGSGLASASPEHPVPVEVNAPLGQSTRLVFAVRQLRHGVTLVDAVPKLGSDVAIATDARNVLSFADKAP